MVRSLMLRSMLYLSFIWYLHAHKILSVNIKGSTLGFPSYLPPWNLSCLVPAWLKYGWRENSKKRNKQKTKINLKTPPNQNLMNMWWFFEASWHYLWIQIISFPLWACYHGNLEVTCTRTHQCLSFIFQCGPVKSTSLPCELQMPVWD